MPNDITQSVQVVYDEMLAAKTAKKTISKALKSELENDKRYKDALEAKKEADAKLKGVKESILEYLQADVDKMNDAAEEESSIKVAVEIAAVKEILKGETVRVTDGRRKLVLKPSYRAEKEE